MEAANLEYPSSYSGNEHTGMKHSHSSSTDLLPGQTAGENYWE